MSHPASAFPGVPPAALLMADHVLLSLNRHREKHAGHEVVPPLFVGVQGPQGSGKTYLTDALRDLLRGPSHNFTVVSFSIDDLYLPHAGLVEVAQAHPQNAMLQGRGLPGTHDLALGSQILESLALSGRPSSTLQTDPSDAVTVIPSFDKSQFKGEGDRAPPSQSTVVHAPVDVVLLEGWMLGFRALDPAVLSQGYVQAQAEASAESRFVRFSLDSLLETNEAMRAYEEWWRALDTFVQIVPPTLEAVYQWRLQQEHALQARTTLQVMTDEQVRAFIDRYMPAYELWLPGVRDSRQSWAGKALEVRLGLEREVVGVGLF